MFLDKFRKNSSSVGAQNKGGDRLSRYEDPTGEFPNRELKMAEWYLRHKLLMQKIGTGLLVAWCVITIGYSLIAWGNYLIFGYVEDRDMAIRQAMEIEDYENIQALYGAADLKVSQVDVFRPAENKYDFVVEVTNPNERWLAHLSYKCVYSGGETELFQTTLLPGAKRPVIVFGHESDTYPTNVKFVIEAVDWESIDPHVVFDVEQYMAERLIFTIGNFSFTKASTAADIPSHIVEFDLYNDSAYSYWEPEFYIELLRNNSLVGVMYLLAEQFGSAEMRHIDLRSVAEQLDVDDVRITPIINVFDEDVFIEPGG